MCAPWLSAHAQDALLVRAMAAMERIGLDACGEDRAAAAVASASESEVAAALDDLSHVVRLRDRFSLAMCDARSHSTRPPRSEEC